MWWGVGEGEGEAFCYFFLLGQALHFLPTRLLLVCFFLCVMGYRRCCGASLSFFLWDFDLEVEEVGLLGKRLELGSEISGFCCI